MFARSTEPRITFPNTVTFEGSRVSVVLLLLLLNLGSDTDHLRIVELQRRDDVSGDARGRRRSERLRRHARQVLAHEGANLAVRRPEVVAPLADAVRLVHNERPERAALVHAGQHRAEGSRLKRLGRDVEQLRLRRVALQIFGDRRPARARAPRQGERGRPAEILINLRSRFELVGQRAAVTLWSSSSRSWSFARAIRGVTTTVVPALAAAGSW